jgi:hypothetical protein
MSQIIVASACLIGLIALGLVFVRFYREGEENDERAERTERTLTEDSHDPDTGVRTRHTVNGFTDRQIAQQARKLTQEVEQYLADQSHCD